MSTFNTLQDDKATAIQKKTYENIMTNEFSRFEVQRIAKYNNISFDYGVTSRDSLIKMMRERNLPIPDDETMKTYIRMHREEVNSGEAATKPAKDTKTPSAKEKPAKPAKDAKTPSAKEKPVKIIVSLNRKNLVTKGLEEGIKGAVTMKSDDLVAKLNAKAFKEK